MCELFAMSSDRPAKLAYELSEFATHGGNRHANGDGWGIVFTQPRDAYLFKAPAAASTSALEQFVACHAPRTRLSIAHVRRASVGHAELCNTHPFQRAVDGRMCHFAHNGDLPELRKHYQDSAALGRCVGDTDSELAFMLLLERLSTLDKSASAHDRFAIFNAFCAEMRAFGDANFLYCEGQTLFVHAHKRRYEKADGLGPPEPPGLHLRRLGPDEATWQVKGAQVEGPGEQRLLIASVPLDDGPWEPLAEATTLQIEAGAIKHRA